MRSPDKIPATVTNKPFPLGDVTSHIQLETANEWFEMVEEYDWERFRGYAELMRKPKTSDSINSRFTHESAVLLCQYWDGARGNGRKFVATGFIIAQSFINDTKFLPNYDADLRIPLERMKTGTDAKMFAKHAWNGMAYSHPNIHAQHERLYAIVDDELDLNKDDNSTYLIAGLSLPYMLSQTAQLDKQARESHFTGLTDEKIDLSRTDFTRKFSSSVLPASNDPRKRLQA